MCCQEPTESARGCSEAVEGLAKRSNPREDVVRAYCVLGMTPGPLQYSLNAHKPPKKYVVLCPSD